MNKNRKKIRLEKSDFLWKLNYGWGPYTPKDTANVCWLFWMSVWSVVYCTFGFLIALPFTVVIVSIVFIMIWLWNVVLLGKVMNGPWAIFTEHKDDPGKWVGSRRDVSDWPHFYGFYVRPWILLALTVVGWGSYKYGPLLSSRVLPLVEGTSATAITSIGIIVFAIATVLMGKYVRKTKTWSLFKIWVKAKKDKVCPIIEVEIEPGSKTATANT